MTDHLQSMLEERGYKFETTAEKSLVEDMKKQICWVKHVVLFVERKKMLLNVVVYSASKVSLDLEADLESSEQYERNSFELPDGQVITVSKER